jgi:hypothetical protein
MIEEGFGLGWLPEHMLTSKRETNLIHAGDSSWQIPLEIRVYKAKQKAHPQLTALWEEIIN